MNFDKDSSPCCYHITCDMHQFKISVTFIYLECVRANKSGHCV